MSELDESFQLADDVIRETLGEEEEESAVKLPPWSRSVAMTTLVLALLSAVVALLAGMTAHESLMTRTSELIELSSLETKRMTIEVLGSKHEVLAAMGQEPEAAELATIQQYRADIEHIVAAAAAEEVAALAETSVHQIFAIGLTILSIAVSLSGMSVVVSSRWLWQVGLGFSAVGVLVALVGFSAMLA